MQQVRLCMYSKTFTLHTPQARINVTTRLQARAVRSAQLRVHRTAPSASGAQECRPTPSRAPAPAPPRSRSARGPRGHAPTLAMTARACGQERRRRTAAG
jgi:hypothetical protein